MVRDGDGYLERRTVGGKSYTVRLNALCANTDCVTLGANVDWSDSRSQEYNRAVGNKFAADVTTVANSVVLVSPVGPVAYGASLVGLGAASVPYFINSDLQPLATTGIASGVGFWLTNIGVPIPAANRAAAWYGEVLNQLGQR